MDIIKSHIDLTAIIETVNGNQATITLLIDQLLSILPKYMEDLNSALQEKQYEKVHRLAHTIKGSLSNFRATIATELAFSLENMGKTANLQNAPTTFDNLQQEVNIILHYLRSDRWQKEYMFS